MTILRRGASTALGCLFAALLALGACAAPPSSQAGNEPVAAAAAAEPSAAPATAGQSQPAVPSGDPAPRIGDPLPPQGISEATAKAAGKVDYTCRTDSDCAMKDVGNCCGSMAACVNKDSPTDPAAVRAQCAKQGRMSMCGARLMAGCKCAKGRCVGIPATIEPSIDPAPAPPEMR